ncbi:MAG: type II secretion system F family protein [Gammaproteobacteria bacterium]|nr:type II secretion system F family protein [Gammaproteobacteria bacterium]
MAQVAREKIYFLYEGTDRKGARVKGEIEGFNADLAKASLRKQGINPLRVKRKPKPLFGGGGKKIIPKDIAIFARQLATMMSAGVPLVQAFEIVGRGHEKPSMQDLILGVKADVEGGSNLSQALAKHPKYFDDLFVNLVDAGEQSGTLETLLDKIATYKEKTEELKAKIKKALFYPAAVMIVAVIVTAILLIFVVPQFEELFKGFGADLPAFTQMVVNMSRWLQAKWYIPLFFIVAAIVAFTQAKTRSKAFSRFLDKISLRAPLFGNILTKAAIARFARTMSTMFAAGVPMVEAMESVAGASGNAVFYDAIMKMREETSTGEQLQASMRRTGLFPNMVVQMVSIGEESGSLDAMLAKVADFYEQEVDNAVDALSSLMEPMIMAFLGVIIGGLVVAMYLPIFKMGSAI